MLKEEQISELQELALSRLEYAESIWGDVGHKMRSFSKVGNEALVLEANMPEFVESQIPDNPIIKTFEPKVDDFIAIVADMRDSTDHLKTYHPGKICLLQRAFYETSVLLPCLAKTISMKNGKVTEYLGDGVLGFFKASKNDVPGCIYTAHNAAKACFEMMKRVVNPLLHEKYSLPDIDIGIGLAKSRAIIYAVGVDNHFEGKLFGECVYYATKISDGRNKIHIDEALKLSWPEKEGGTLRFLPTRRKNIDCFEIQNSNN